MTKIPCGKKNLVLSLQSAFQRKGGTKKKATRFAKINFPKKLRGVQKSSTFALAFETRVWTQRKWRQKKWLKKAWKFCLEIKSCYLCTPFASERRKPRIESVLYTKIRGWILRFAFNGRRARIRKKLQKVH